MVDDVVKQMMERLLKSAADSFELAVARFDTRERQAALAHARDLRESPDPAERRLGEELEAEVLRMEQAPRVIELESTPGNGEVAHPLSLPSSKASHDAATPSAAPEEGQLKKRGPGRPRKSETAPPEAPRRKPGRRPRQG